MTARVIAAAVAVTLLVGVSAPPLGAQQPVAGPPVQDSTSETPQPIPTAQSEPVTSPAPAQEATPASAPAPPSPAPAAPERAAAAAAPATPPPAAPPSSPAMAPGSGSSHSQRTDVYDVAGGVVTVLKAPFNVGLCALGGVVGVALFALTLGSGYRVAARAVEEGCSGPWVVTGEDLRPERGRPATRLSDLYPGELEGR
jgi:hypothetical protein